MTTFDAHARACAARIWRHGLLAAVLVAGCQSSSDPEPVDTTPPPTTPPPTTPPAATVPLLDPIVVALDDGHRVGTSRWPQGNTTTGGQGLPVDGLECLTVSHGPVHIHAHLSIFLDGVALAIPAHIGVVELTPTSECHYPLHTHDPSGMLHQHSRTPTLFTLGQFFAVWGQPLSRTNVAGLSGLPVTVYVTDAGVARIYTGDDLGSLQLLSHREITIQVGTPIAQIPQFTWAGE